MASIKTQALILLLSLSSISSVITSSLAAGRIAVYWGQNVNEGTLTTACDTGNYEIVLLAFLHKFGAGRTPEWNFAGHCGSWSPCTKLQPEIEHCQSRGIEVLLSIGGAPEYSDYSLSSPEDAKEVANYLYDNFLSGKSGPLGAVTLDGIDFDIEKTESYWDDLARELDALRQPNKNFYLSAAPQCPIPIYYLGKAIETGLFDYVLVQFYNNDVCSYASGVSTLLEYWDKWAALLPSNNSLFMGLLAGPGTRDYIPPAELISQVLPHIKQTANYGGVMLWDRYRDSQYHYSDSIRRYVLTSVYEYVTAVSDALYGSVSLALGRFLPKSSA